MSYIDQITVGSTTYDIKDANAIAAPSSATTNAVLAYNGTNWTADKRTVILSYGSSTWQDFLNAFNNNAVIYCRASSNSNPASGSQTRHAFLAYVNNLDTPTEVEFQYYRSVNTHSDAQQGDQVFVYKLNSSGTWSVTTREAYTKIAVGAGLSKSYSSGILTLTNDAMDIVAIQSAQPSSETNKLWIYDAEGSGIEIPTMDDVYGLGITGAQAGDYLKVFSVDSEGRPTGYITEGNNILYYTDVAVAAASGDIISINSSAITVDHVVSNIDWNSPQYITTNITWTTTNGNVTLNGTCSSATTANILLIKKSN